MEKVIKKVLNEIEKNGFEAYIVGGYVRDLLLNKITFDIDICTNALPKDLKNMFPNGVLGEYGTLSFKVKSYDFEITTYRKENNYDKRHPREVSYINNLFEDLSRRDFTINTICMNSKGIIIDVLDGCCDIDKKLIKMVGNPDAKFQDDPLRMLRAIRFATILNFSLDESVLNSITNNKELILELSKNRIKIELDKIFLSEFSLRGIKLLDDIGILSLLNIKHKEIQRVNDINGMWSQFEIDDSYPFTKEEKNNIIKIKEITKKGTIDNDTLFYNGLYLSTVAGEILGIDKKIINDMYKKLSIYSIKDLCVSANEISNYLGVEPGKELGSIINELISKVLSKELKNTKKSVLNYLKIYKEVCHED